MTKPSTASELREGAEAIAEEAPLVVVRIPRIEEALALVAEDVREVRKTGTNTSQNFNFRGIDAVVNAVGPAFRRRGVVCLPLVEDIRMEPMPLSGGKQATRVLVTVRYRFHGPAGDHLDAVSVGEAFDMGDKATAKAMSVAYRTCLLQSLTIPTDDPDPDEHTYEQAAPAPEWDAKMTKFELRNLLNGDAQQAREAWEYASGDALTEFGADVAKRIADAWLERPIEEPAPTPDTEGEGQ